MARKIFPIIHIIGLTKTAVYQQALREIDFMEDIYGEK